MKSEDHLRIDTPVDAIAIEKPLQLADSLADRPVRIRFKVSFSCELATALHVRINWQLMLSVQCAIGMWMHTFYSVLMWMHPCVYMCILPELCVHKLALEEIHA